MHPRGGAIVAALTVLLLAASERTVRAQACCTSTSAIFPARLQDDEDALLGLAVKGAGIFGSFDQNRVLHGQPNGAGEIDLGQTMLVTARMFPPVQLNVSLPFVETWRSASGQGDFGGGVSDLSFSVRVDMFHAGRDPVVPGIATLFNLTVPSGTPVELARNPLATDATGLGAAQLGAGLALEQTFGRALFALTGTVNFHGARTAFGVHSQLGPEIATTVGASYTFLNGFSLGGSLTYMNSFDSTEGSADVPGSARAFTQVAISGALPIRNGRGRILGSLFFVPPMSAIGQNEPANVGASLTFIYGFKNQAYCEPCATGSCTPRK